MRVIAETDVGLVRNENQDSFRVKLIDDNTALMIVCDGMGGENAGGEASEVAADAIFERITSNYRNTADNNSIRNLIISALNAANSLVYEKSISHESKYGMGTTCVCGIIRNNTAYIASVGDSRGYVICNNEIRQITNDHTYVKILLDQGKINKDEIKYHPQRNVITRAVGIEERIEPDYFEIDLAPSSVVLMCSDGLSGYCSDEFLLEVISGNDLETAEKILIDYANQQGGKDNITVALTSN